MKIIDDPMNIEDTMGLSSQAMFPYIHRFAMMLLILGITSPIAPPKSPIAMFWIKISVILSNLMAWYFSEETRMGMFPGLLMVRVRMHHDTHRYCSASLNPVDVLFWDIFCVMLGVLAVRSSVAEFMFSLGLAII